MVITLIGYRGSGKSVVAPQLAAALSMTWVDADTEIEREADMSIRTIFAHEGESGFRRRERAVMVRLMQQNEIVIAAGGGAILDADTRLDLRNAGPVVWLTAAEQTLADRISGDMSSTQRRPALTHSTSVLDEIREVLAVRKPLYAECATLTVDTDDLTPESIVQKILAGLELSTDRSDP